MNKKLQPLHPFSGTVLKNSNTNLLQDLKYTFVK